MKVSFIKKLNVKNLKVDVPFKNDMTCILKFAFMYRCLLKSSLWKMVGKKWFVDNIIISTARCQHSSERSCVEKETVMVKSRKIRITNYVPWHKLNIKNRKGIAYLCRMRYSVSYLHKHT